MKCMENSKVFFFTTEEGNLLIRLVIAHLLSDFIFQSNRIAKNKNWSSKEMFFHILVVYFTTALISGWWILSFAIAILHYLIDGLKVETEKKYPDYSFALFWGDQILHGIVLLSVWVYQFGIYENLLKALIFPIKDYKISLILLGYILITTPIGYVIKFVLKNIPSSIDTNDGTNQNREQGGKTIGIFERSIILTFVLLGQYEAIGFLITGKSIIRFANQQEHIRSEYVLVGTMMSYGFSIIVGVLINFLV
jgi:hypothetical protein